MHFSHPGLVSSHWRSILAVSKDRAASPQASLWPFGVYNYNIHVLISYGFGVLRLLEPSQYLPGAKYSPFYRFGHEKMKIYRIYCWCIWLEDEMSLKVATIIPQSVRGFSDDVAKPYVVSAWPLKEKRGPFRVRDSWLSMVYNVPTWLHILFFQDDLATNIFLNQVWIHSNS